MACGVTESHEVNSPHLNNQNAGTKLRQPSPTPLALIQASKRVVAAAVLPQATCFRPNCAFSHCSLPQQQPACSPWWGGLRLRV